MRETGTLRRCSVPVDSVERLAATCLEHRQVGAEFDSSGGRQPFGGLSLGIPGKQFREPTLQGTLTFLRRNPYTYDRYPRRVSTNGAGAE